MLLLQVPFSPPAMTGPSTTQPCTMPIDRDEKEWMQEEAPAMVGDGEQD